MDTDDSKDKTYPLKIPGPPPNPRRRNAPHLAYSPAAATDLGLEGTQLTDRHSLTEEQGLQAADQALPVNDMSTSAELEVSLEAVQNTGRQIRATDAPSAYVHGNNIHNPIFSQDNNNRMTGGDFPVFYSKQNGGVALRSDTVKPQPDGRQVIQTSQYQSPPNRFENDRPLTKRYQLVLKILSFIALALFFPTGIPAAYFAFKTEKEFNAGILRGDIDKARKCGKRAEKLIIFSFLLFVMVIVLTFALIERAKWTEDQWRGHQIVPGK